MKSRVFLIAALTVSAAFVFAQGGQGGAAGPGGQGNRQGARGQGRGGFGQFNRGGFGQNELQLALRKDVQADLAVTDEQKKKLEEFSAKQREARRAQFGDRRPGGQGGAVGAGGAAGGATGGATGGAAGGAQGERPRRNRDQGANVDRDAMRAQAEARRAETRKALGEILNEGQMKRLDEIALQLRGNSALMSPDTQKALNFTADQTKKIQDLLQKQREANQSIQEKARNQEISREEAQASREKNNKVLGDELWKILTAEQQAKFTAMQGKPFKADPNEGGRGGRGGGS